MTQTGLTNLTFNSSKLKSTIYESGFFWNVRADKRTVR
jgi:hypothetical protein